MDGVLLIDYMAVALPRIQVGSKRGSGRIQDIDRLEKVLNDSKSGNILRVPINATHSGTIVNNRVYPGVHMRDGAASWVKPYKRPFTDGHPSRGLLGGSEAPVLGRVQAAQFHSLVPEDALRQDFKKPKLRDKGSGFIRLDVGVTDDDAIEKIQDSRLLTVSSGQRSNRMDCSVCGQNWLDNWCDHRPGKTYEVEVPSGKSRDGKTRKVSVRMFHITGPLEYDHIAAVMSPAQPYARIVAEDIKDSLDKDSYEFMQFHDESPLDAQALVYELSDREGRNRYVLADSAEILEAFLQDSSDEGEDSAYVCVAFEDLPSSKAVSKGDVMGGKTKSPETSADNPKVEDSSDETKDPRTFTAMELAERTIAASIFDAGLEEYFDEDEVEELRSLADELDADDYQLTEDQMLIYFDGEVPEDIKEDATLTTKARKRLPDSTFCGPDRSFPVPDCSHAANAKARLNQAKLSADQKKRVLSCVNRKAKAMNCFKKSSNGDSSEIDPTVEVKPGQHLGGKIQDDKEPEKKRPVTKKVDIQSMDREALIAYCVALKAEAKDTHAQVNQLVGETVDLSQELRDTYATHVYDYKKRLGRKVPEDAQEAIDKLSGRSLEFLRDSYLELREELEAEEAEGATKVETKVDAKQQPLVHEDKSPRADATGNPGDTKDKPQPPKGNKEHVRARLAGQV